MQRDIKFNVPSMMGLWIWSVVASVCRTQCHLSLTDSAECQSVGFEKFLPKTGATKEFCLQDYEE